MLLVMFFFLKDTAPTEIYTYCTLFPYTTLFRSLSVTTHQTSLPSRVLRSWPMRHLGLLSYGMYLFHIPVIIILRPYNLAQEQLFLAVASLTWVIAIVGYLAVEKQFLLLKPKSVRRSEEHTSELQSLMRISYA